MSEEVSASRIAPFGVDEVEQSLTREQLYNWVWREPMLRVAERLGVSSIYMARVCTELMVPRPPPGYWAQVEFGKTPVKPDLPPSRPGDVTVWSPGRPIGTAQRSTAKRTEPATHPEPLPRKKSSHETRHDLLVGVKPHFLKTRDSDTGLLRPFKRLLVDVTSSQKHLDSALDAADLLFRALAVKGYRVVLAPPNAQMRRGEVDVREAPKQNNYHRAGWTPDRPTVVYIGGVPIGLALFEMTEEVEVVYVSGDYLPVRGLSAMQARRFTGPHHWKTTRELPSGRLCLQAYCPSWMVEWTQQWRETNASPFASLVPQVVRDLEGVGPELARKVAEAERRAEEEHIKWEEESRRRQEEAERLRQARARQDARQDLLGAIAAWDQTQKIHEYFAAAERELERLPEAEQQLVRERLGEAKALIGEVDALELLKRWQAPHER